MSIEEVDKIMAMIHPNSQKRWCISNACACMGCVQVSNRAYAMDAEGIRGSIPKDIFGKYEVTREDWEAWTLRQSNA